MRASMEKGDGSGGGVRPTFAAIGGRSTSSRFRLTGSASSRRQTRRTRARLCGEGDLGGVKSTIGDGRADQRRREGEWVSSLALPAQSKARG